MALAERAQLVAELRLDDKMSAGLTKAGRSVKGFGGIVSKGMATAARNITLIGIAAAGALTGLVALSIKEGQEAARVETIYAKAIANSGKVSASYVAVLRDQQTELMNLAGIDDELIKAEQTKLIQMGLAGKQVAALTPLILDMSKATGKDLLTSTVAVGKATMGNAASLQKFGVFVDKAKFKVDPFVATMEALNQKFGGTTKALSGSLEARLGALHEGLANIREEAGMKLLPALTRIVDVIGKSVVPAFAKLMDRIMPGITAGIDDLAKALEGGGAEKAIGGIADALGTVLGLLQAAAGPVKMIVGAFMSLPKELQTILVAGFAVNKLTGGMVTQLAGEILFKRGGSPANPLFVADVTGGLGGGALKGGKGILGALTSLPVLIGGAALAGVLTAVQSGIQEGHQAQADANASATEKLLRTGSLADLRNSLRGLENMPDELDPLKKVLYDLNANGVKTHTETLEQAIRDEIASREKRATAGATVATANIQPLLTAAAVGLPPGAVEVITRAVEHGKTPTSSAITATLTRAAEETKRAAAVQAIAARAQAILQSVTNIRLATIAAKDWSPTLYVTVPVTNVVSVRAMASQTVTNTRYQTGKRTIYEPDVGK